MIENRVTAEKFESLLTRLSEDREQAGLEYIRLRDKLANLLRFKGHSSPEDGADVVLDRVAEKLAEGESIRDLAAYSRGVANFVALEDSRKQSQTRKGLDYYSFFHTLSETFDDRLFRLMRRCLGDLPVEQKSLLEDYYDDTRRQDMSFRRQILAERMAMSLNALRLHIFRIRAKLENCFENNRRALD